MTDTKTKILLIEDNQRLASLIIQFVSVHGFELVHASSGKDVDALSVEDDFELIICDVMLPDTDGFSLYEKLAERISAPIIYLTALGDDEDHIKGLELGAIDYIVKPVEPTVLLARIRACLRKNQKVKSLDKIEIDNLLVDKTSETVLVDNKTLDLTHHDFELFWIFAKNQGKPLTREFLFTAVLGREYNGLDRTVDSRTMRLRKKLKEFKIPGLSIRTVWGKGYLFTYSPPV